MLTPGAKPNATAKFAVSLAVISNPPLFTNSCKCSTPAQPRPGRMSSVSSVFPKFGVSCVTFHSSGLPYIGILLTIVCGLPRTPGANTIAVVFGAQVGGLRCCLRADVFVGNLQAVKLQAPPAFTLRAEPSVHDGDSCGARWMGLHLRRRGHCVCLYAEFGGGLG
jgi:hypothetical protein